MPRTKQDPLIAALIAKLPKTGEDWSVDQQLAWLRLMAMAFGNVYGGDAAAQFGRDMASNNRPLGFPSLKEPSSPTKTVPPVHRFYIDADGYAKKASGERILAKDVYGEIFDTRGEYGDMKTIIWADDSKGLNGADLVITA